MSDTAPRPLKENIERLRVELESRAELARRVRPLDQGDEMTPAETALARDADIAVARRARWEALVPRRFIRATDADIDDLPPDTAAKVRDWVDNPDGRNLVIVGAIGAGKSHLAIAACHRAFMAGLDFRFYPLVELLDALRPGGSETALSDLGMVDRLVIDDLGTERATDWTAERLFALVNRRWLEEAPLVVTSNLDAAALQAAIGERTFSRLVGGAVTIRLMGDDRRRTR